MPVPGGKEKLGEKLSDFGTNKEPPVALPPKDEGENVGESRAGCDIEPNPGKGKGDRACAVAALELRVGEVKIVSWEACDWACGWRNRA